MLQTNINDRYFYQVETLEQAVYSALIEKQQQLPITPIPVRGSFYKDGVDLIQFRKYMCHVYLSNTSLNSLK